MQPPPDDTTHAAEDLRPGTEVYVPRAEGWSALVAVVDLPELPGLCALELRLQTGRGLHLCPRSARFATR